VLESELIISGAESMAACSFRTCSGRRTLSRECTAEKLVADRILESKNSVMNLSILFHRLGPYHRARLGALASRCTLTAIEFCTVDNTNAWDIISEKEAYPIVSLFTDADIDTKPIDAIVRKMKAVLGQVKPQLVAIPGWSSPAALAALEWCCSTETPAILMSESTSHDEPRIWWKEWVKTRIVGLFSSALVGGTPHVDYVAALGLARQRVFTGYDVVDNDYFAARSDMARSDASALRLQHGLPTRYLLASNRFIEKKNLLRLLEAYAGYVERLGAAAWDLVLLGDGPMKAALADQVARLGLIERVQLPGFKQYDQLPVFYGLATAFIQASTTEQWGLVVNEAMASGLPVLVSERCGCTPNLVKNGINGFTFDPYDVEGMIGRMLDISGDKCDLAAMGQASREVIRNWSPETFASNMLKAAGTAMTAARRRASWLDRALLWMLMRR
jgi:glycosyltransferase involved in cell wall biosynthesis